MTQDIIRIGTVTAIYDEKGTVLIHFEDKNDLTLELPLLSWEYNMPKLQDTVWCIFLSNGIETGLCLGKAYSVNNMPLVLNRDVFHKPLVDNSKSFIEYDAKTETFTIKAKNIIFDCDFAISTGELSDKTRMISADRLIFNNHIHGVLNDKTTTPTEQQ